MTQIEVAALLGWGFAVVCFLAWVRRYYMHLALHKKATKLAQETAKLIVMLEEYGIKVEKINFQALSEKVTPVNSNP